MKKLVGVTLGFLVSVPAAAGAIYQWRDENGQMHYGDRPPAGARVEEAKVQAATEGEPAADNGLRAGERAWLSEIEKRQKADETQKRLRDRRSAAVEARRENQNGQDARRCAGYREKIRDYQSRLRSGCRVSRCNSYNEQLARYKSKAELVCR